jgi:hypothetical protein
MQTRSLHIHIDRLSLEGKSAAEGRRIVAAMERRLTELANRVATPLAANNAAIQRMDAGTLAHGASPGAIGGHIATQIYRKLGGPRGA